MISSLTLCHRPPVGGDLAVKIVTTPMLGFKSLLSARIFVARIEVKRMTMKEQMICLVCHLLYAADSEQIARQRTPIS